MGENPYIRSSNVEIEQRGESVDGEVTVEFTAKIPKTEYVKYIHEDDGTVNISFPHPDSDTDIRTHIIDEFDYEELYHSTDKLTNLLGPATLAAFGHLSHALIEIHEKGNKNELQNFINMACSELDSQYVVEVRKE